MSSVTPDPLFQLLSFIRTDQAERWRRGELARVEDYLTLYPDLAREPEALLDLIGSEVQHRRENGEHPTPEEYLGRFPQLGDSLRRRWVSPRREEPPGQSDSDNLATTAPGPTEDSSITPRFTSAPSLPGFEMQEKLGESGMGIVYKARDLRLNQFRAIKFIRAAITDEAAQERFGREAKAAARLDHPGVVRIQAMGEHQGELFICMEYLDGGNLHSRLRRGLLDAREAAELVRQLALAVQHAHDNHVLHRDLKPANVLLTASGTPKVADFGLAKLLDEDDGLTRIGDVMGTPSYMAPEQAEGRQREVGERADVWALGTILYECLTGRPPFRGEGRTETMELVKTRAPVPPRRLRAEIPRELESICLKCLEKRSEHRFATAAELADHLQAWLDGKPMRIRPERRRHQLVAILMFLLLVAVSSGVLWLRPWRQLEPDAAPVGRQDSDAPAMKTSRPSLIPGVWNSLLTHEPIPLHWPERAENSYNHFLPGSQEIDLSCEELGLLVLGETSATRYRFAITIHQSSWDGNIGVFFGYHDSQINGEPSQRYQILELSSDMNARQGRILRVGWSSLSQVGIAKSQRQFNDMHNASPPFPPTSSPHRLELTVGPKGLEKATWDDKVLDGLSAKDAANPPPPEDYKGKFGIFAFKASGIFRAAEFKFQEEP